MSAMKVCVQPVRTVLPRVNRMKIKTSPTTVKQLLALRENYLSSNYLKLKRFLDGLSVENKYEIVAIAWAIKGSYPEECWDELLELAKEVVPISKLTEYLVDFPWLECHLQDALSLKWSYFEKSLYVEAIETDDD